MVDFFNYLYIWGHLPVIIAVAIWLYTRHRENYALFRNAFLISGLIALIGFSDGAAGAAAIHAGVRLHGHDRPRAVVLRVPEPEDREPVRRDAEPALRLGSARRHRHRHERARRRLRWIAVVLPVVMLGGIVLTANHYFLDAAAGALVALMGLGIAWAIRRGIHRTDGVFGFLA